jgi:outer membrane protein assembly factor BamB
MLGRPAKRTAAIAIAVLVVLVLALPAGGCVPSGALGRVESKVGLSPQPGAGRTVRVIVRNGDDHAVIPKARISGVTSGTALTEWWGGTTCTVENSSTLNVHADGYTDANLVVSAETTRFVFDLYYLPWQWSKFGYDAQRDNFNPAFTIAPPYKNVWRFSAGSLLEYPASAYKGRLYFLTASGNIFCLWAATGRKLWMRSLHEIFGAQPAVDDELVYMGGYDGIVTALKASTGKPAWRFDTGGHIESSPVLDGEKVYVGSWNRAMVALNKRTGRQLWRFETGGAIKDTPAIDGNKLYFGSYDGAVYCVDKRNGSLIWRTGIGGTVYSSPAVSGGRVYIGSTAGNVVCLSGSSGAKIWSFQTQNSRFGVYSSPAVAHGMVYVGSYDGTFYALDARSGYVHWTHSPGGAISGSPAVIGDIVYMASFGGRSWALDAKSGRVLFAFPSGRYTPASANGRYLFITGTGAVYAYKGTFKYPHGRP